MDSSDLPLVSWSHDANRIVVTPTESSRFRSERGPWGQLLHAMLSPSPARTLNEAYTYLGMALEKHANRAAHSLGLGPQPMSHKIRSYLGDGEERFSQLELLRTSPSETLEKQCSKLMKYCLPTESLNTQCQAFKEILTLVTLFPGLRGLLLRTKSLGNATSIEAICAVWEPSQPRPDAEWIFWERLAAECLIHTNISAILEEASFSDLCTCREGGLSIIERLLIERDCSGSFTNRSALCVRYLGGILSLPGFWMSTEDIHNQVVGKLFREMVRILKDIGVDVPSMGSLADSVTVLPFDYDGVDSLAGALLTGILGRVGKLDREERHRQPWHAGFIEFLQLLRQPRAGELLPSASACATTNFRDIVPVTLREAVLYVAVDGDNVRPADERTPEYTPVTELECGNNSTPSVNHESPDDPRPISERDVPEEPIDSRYEPRTLHEVDINDAECSNSDTDSLETTTLNQNEIEAAYSPDSDELENDIGLANSIMETLSLRHDHPVQSVDIPTPTEREYAGNYVYRPSQAPGDSESRKVFELKTLTSDTFFILSPKIPAAHPAFHERFLTGKVTCSVPFNTWDGRALVAVGCAEGVWFGFRHDPQSMRPVLHMKMVKDCAVLEDLGIFLVLADKSLLAYQIEALVPSPKHEIYRHQTPQKVRDNVQFFRVGSFLGVTVVILVKKKNFGSVFHVVEPSKKRIDETLNAPAGIGGRLMFHQPQAEWFRRHKTFSLPYEAFDVISLETKLAISCTKGFVFVDLLDLKTTTVLGPGQDARFENLAKRCDFCRPIGIFRASCDDFLLCYTEFGLYVNRHGNPSLTRPRPIEWEEPAKQVAFHAPYILLFNTRFIEVRDVDTARLIQIIPGDDMHCLWSDSRHTPNRFESMAECGLQEARVHGVKNAPEGLSDGRAPHTVAQHVFQLIPTIPSHTPGAESPPTNVNLAPSQ